MQELFHYCSNEKCFNALTDHSIRLSDIQKSNDYKELNLMFPKIYNVLETLYLEKPFRFKLDGKTNIEAIRDLLGFSYEYWESRFSRGDFSNFVLYFSKAEDSLSQWRGYANNGKGCCLGFSFDELVKICDNSKGVLRIEKVCYLVDEGIDRLILDTAKDILNKLKTLRKFIVKEITGNDSDPETDNLLRYNFDGLLESAFIDSLKYKSFYFNEECEWRIFFAHNTYKNPDWVCRKNCEELTGPNGFNETIHFLNNNIQFNITENDIIPYVPIKITDRLLTSIRIGPKSNIREQDLLLFLRKNKYKRADIKKSKITYC